jgi:hypothetical protein
MSQPKEIEEWFVTTLGLLEVEVSVFKQSESESLFRSNCKDNPNLLHFTRTV